MDLIEKNRIRRNKEEDSERIKLMGDMIKLYEKMKAQDSNNVEFEKKITHIND